MPEPAQPRQLEQVYIRDVATFKALADPLRLQILMELALEPKAVKEVASTLQAPATRLYYHFKILEHAGLIRVVERRMVSGIEESRYEAIGESWQPAPDATADLVKSGVIRALLSMIRAEIELAFLSPADLPAGDPKGPVPILTMTELTMSEADVVEVQERLGALMEEFAVDGAPAAGKRLYRAFFAGYLPPAELRDRSDQPTGRGVAVSRPAEEPKKPAATRGRRATRAKKARRTPARRKRAPRAT